MDKITLKNISNYRKKNTKKKNLLNNIISSVDITQIQNRNTVTQRNNIFYKKIKTDSNITNQENSGRCWIFSFLNLLRLNMIDKYKLSPDFELSQTYLFFWDKLEKSNLFLKYIIETKELDLDSRLVNHLLKEPTSDGGQWNMLVNLINKYGIIPKTTMNETYHSENSQHINTILNDRLREYAYKIRNNDIQKKTIDNYLAEIYKLLVYFLGEPPTKITWKYYSKDKKEEYTKYNSDYNITPLYFYKKYINTYINDYVVLINVPSKNRPFYNKYDLKYFGNVNEGVNTNYINIPTDEFIDIARKSLDEDQPVWFGCDVDKYLSANKGYLDEEFFIYDDLLDNKIEIDKGNKLNYNNSSITHAMLIKGYDIDENKNVIKWLIENSWGEDDNDLKGNLIMSNQWFKDYVYEIVVHKKYVNNKILNCLKKKPVMLEPWDPLGLLLFT